MNKAETMREEARHDFYKSIKQSWTYARLTEDEQFEVMQCIGSCKLYGSNKDHVFETLNQIYRAFLAGTGYSCNGWNTWRQTAEEKGA